MASNHNVGNQGLYFVAYILSRRGLNTIITARNSKGADIIVMNGDCSVLRTIQVKASRRQSNVNVGSSESKDDPPTDIACDYWVFVDLQPEIPRCFVYAKQELIPYYAPGKYKPYPDKNAKKQNWWLQSGSIYAEDALEKWDKIRV